LECQSQEHNHLFDHCSPKFSAYDTVLENPLYPKSHIGSKKQKSIPNSVNIPQAKYLSLNPQISFDFLNYTIPVDDFGLALTMHYYAFPKPDSPPYRFFSTRQPFR
jgi:hypothetical protein